MHLYSSGKNCISICCLYVFDHDKNYPKEKLQVVDYFAHPSQTSDV